MTYYGPISDVHMIVYEELYFNQIVEMFTFIYKFIYIYFGLFMQLT